MRTRDFTVDLGDCVLGRTVLDDCSSSGRSQTTVHSPLALLTCLGNTSGHYGGVISPPGEDQPHVVRDAHVEVNRSDVLTVFPTELGWRRQLAVLEPALGWYRNHSLRDGNRFPHDPWTEPPGYLTTGDFSGELRAFYGPRENTVGAMEREGDSDVLPQWSNTWTNWSDASLLNSTP
jgi:hypothetical protein